MLSSRADRTGRGIVAATIATFAATFSHSIADGRPAPLLGIVLALALAVPLCVALAGRRLSWVRLSVAVGLSQFAYHGLIRIGIGEAWNGSPSLPATLHAHAGAAPLGSAESAGTAGAAHLHADPGMWVAHLVAAIVTVLAIGAGERAIRRLLELTGWRFVALLLDWAPPVRRPRDIGIAPGRAPSAQPSLLTEVSRRGPPLAA